MNREIAERWVEELRSGKWKKAVGHLALRQGVKSFRHCCLGVLCEMAIRDGVQVEIKDDGDHRCFDEEVGVLPESVMKWAGLETARGQFKQRIGENALTYINDHSEGWERTIEAIEQHVEEL